MTDKDNQPTASLFERCVTRREMLLTSSGALAGILLVGCAGSQEEGAQESAEPVTGEFVGRASGQDAYVGLFAAEGGSEGESEVIAYICNGPGGLAEWFRGMATENAADLDSDDGDARLQATLEEGGPEGTIELPDGDSVSFETARTGDGPEGLYQLALDPDGRISGTSWGGKSLEVQGSPGVGPRGTVTLPDGETLQVEFPVKESTTEAGEFRAVMLPDGTARGSKTRSTGSTRNNGDFLSPISF